MMRQLLSNAAAMARRPGAYEVFAAVLCGALAAAGEWPAAGLVALVLVAARDRVVPATDPARRRPR
jgi:hypothetical protein